MGVFAPLLLKLMPSLPDPLFKLAAMVGAWWIGRSADKEAQLKNFEEGVREIQSRRLYATRAADDIAQALKNLDSGKNDLDPPQDERGPPA